MEKYIGQELKGIVQSIQVKQGTARETGSPYYYVSLTFINGFEKRLFLQSAESFALTNAIDQMQTQKVVDNNF